MLPNIPDGTFVALFVLAATGALSIIAGIIWAIWFFVTKVQVTII
jgi:hypothetical protein